MKIVFCRLNYSTSLVQAVRFELTKKRFLKTPCLPIAITPALKWYPAPESNWEHPGSKPGASANWASWALSWYSERDSNSQQTEFKSVMSSNCIIGAFFWMKVEELNPSATAPALPYLLHPCSRAVSLQLAGFQDRLSATGPHLPINQIGGSEEIRTLEATFVTCRFSKPVLSPLSHASGKLVGKVGLEPTSQTISHLQCDPFAAWVLPLNLAATAGFEPTSSRLTAGRFTS